MWYYDADHPLRRFFSGLAEHTIAADLGVADPPLTCTGVCAVEPIYGVIVYPVTGLPPLFAGADQLTNAREDAGLAATFCGADGADAPVGVTAFDDADTGPDPVELVACTVNV